jgi:hypothetical protein
MYIIHIQYIDQEIYQYEIEYIFLNPLYFKDYVEMYYFCRQTVGAVVHSF